jgi:undecaprenyl-diphosphatase
MFEALELADRNLFFAINGLHSYWMDNIIYQATQTVVYIPLFLVAIFFLVKQYGKKIILIIITVALLITCCDQFANLFKKNIKRYRPTHNLEIRDKVHTVNNYKGGTYGFVSGHASNAFGIAMFLFLLFTKMSKKIRLLFFLWALWLSYTRIYLGVHYPSDILRGALLGILLATLFYKLFLFAEIKIFTNKSN